MKHIFEKIKISTISGSCYAKSAGFDHAFELVDVEKMSRTVNNEQTDLFGCPPKGFTIVNNVPATSEFNVLTGEML